MHKVLLTLKHRRRKLILIHKVKLYYRVKKNFSFLIIVNILGQ